MFLIFDACEMCLRESSLGAATVREAVNYIPHEWKDVIHV